MSEKTIILSHKQVVQKIKRIAFQIYENNHSEKEVILAGIRDQGYTLARLLKDCLEEISELKLLLVGVSLDKEAPTQSDISLDCEVSELKNKSIVLIDDVSNTGRTLAYSLKPFLNIRVKKLETAVLVNRSHVKFPVSVKYSGYELATTIKEHVEVDLENSQKIVYLY